jgi:hypothetical protein
MVNKLVITVGINPRSTRPNGWSQGTSRMSPGHRSSKKRLMMRRQESSPNLLWQFQVLPPPLDRPFHAFECNWDTLIKTLRWNLNADECERLRPRPRPTWQQPLRLVPIPRRPTSFSPLTPEETVGYSRDRAPPRNAATRDS